MRYFFGHPSEWIEQEDGSEKLFYVDTGEACWETPLRPCPKCHETPISTTNGIMSGDDPCIAKLPGVDYACCGHGVENGYIKFKDGRIFRFENIHPSTSQPHPLMED